MSEPRCHQRASPIECRRPGRPSCPGRVTESCRAVHIGSSGTGRWNRNQSFPGVLCLIQYSRGWSARIWIPERMMNTISSRLRKWVTSTNTGRPGASRDAGPWIAVDEAGDRGDVPEPLAGRHRDDQQHEADGKQPQQVEPPARPDPDPRGHAVGRRQRPRPPVGVDGILALGEPIPVGDQRVRGAGRAAEDRIGS
jgi:hypothetical protein